MPAISMPDLPSFKVVPPRADVKPSDLQLSDGTPMVGPDGLLVPAARQFSMIVGGANRMYSYRFDEALRDNMVAARAMRRDAFLEGLFEERILPTINREWQLEVDDPDDPNQRYVRDGLTSLIKNIPDFDAFKRANLDGVWYGRAGCQWSYQRKPDLGNKWGMGRWDPLHGDSLQFTYDGVPALLLDGVTESWYRSHGATIGPNGDLRPTDHGGTALVLHRPYWRDRFSVHVHMRRKADYYDGELAGSVQGLGLRGLVYWHYVLRTDALTWMLAYMQAVGQMDLLVFNYPTGNANAERQQINNAQKIIGKAAIACPRDPKGSWPAVEQIQMNSAGLKALHDLVADYFDRHIERLFVGQSMSSGADKGDGLGGTGRADFARATKDEILVYDTGRLDGTFTSDVVDPLKRYNYPWAKFPVRFKSTMPDVKAREKVDSGGKLISLGIPVKVSEMLDAAGFTMPKATDAVAGMPIPPQMSLPPGTPPGGFAGQMPPPQMPPMLPPGMPGQMPMGGAAPQQPGGPPVQNAAYGPHGGPNRTFGMKLQLPAGPTNNDSGGGGTPPVSGPAMGYPGGSNTYLPTFGPKKRKYPILGQQYSRQPTPYRAGPFDFCSTQINLNGYADILLQHAAKSVPDVCLHEKGREDESHVTVRFGLHKQVTAADVARLLVGQPAIRLFLGKVSCFLGADTHKDYDVLKVDVDSPDLRALNQTLGTLPNTETFKYNPHATIAYVKKGLGAQLAAKMEPLNLGVIARYVCFSDQMGNKVEIPLADAASRNGQDVSRRVVR